MTSLLTIRRTDLAVRECLAAEGRIFRTQFPNDSGNELFGVDCVGTRLFVKHSQQPRHVEAFHKVERLYQRVGHEALPPLRNGFGTPGGYALVFDWLDAEHYANEGARARFAALGTEEKLRAFGTLVALHAALEAAGYVAEDLYDGCFMYDFGGRRMYMCDLDEYHEGPFVLDRERTFGSTRFMAPEEWVRGSRIDGRTTVYNLGRAAAVLLGDRAGSAESVAGTTELRAVIARATQARPADRFASVAEMAEAFFRLPRAGL